MISIVVSAAVGYYSLCLRIKNRYRFKSINSLPFLFPQNVRLSMKTLDDKLRHAHHVILDWMYGIFMPLF